MKKLLFASATALSLIAAPVMAQGGADAPLGSTNSVEDKRPAFTPDQQAVYDSLTPEYRSDFDAWDTDRQVLYFGWTDALRGYYWTLDDAQQDAWWYLSPEQRIDMFQLQGSEREIAWNSVLEQVALIESSDDNADYAYAETTAPTITYANNGMVQDVPAPADTYPVCKSDAQDSCINAWAAGERGPGVDRPLDYWPGHPASEESHLGG